MKIFTCDSCGHYPANASFGDLDAGMEEIADLLAGGHAEAAYRLIEPHLDLGPIEWRRRKIAGHGTPAHLLSGKKAR